MQWQPNDDLKTGAKTAVLVREVFATKQKPQHVAIEAEDDQVYVMANRGHVAKRYATGLVILQKTGRFCKCGCGYKMWKIKESN